MRDSLQHRDVSVEFKANVLEQAILLERELVLLVHRPLIAAPASKTRWVADGHTQVTLFRLVPEQRIWSSME